MRLTVVYGWAAALSVNLAESRTFQSYIFGDKKPLFVEQFDGNGRNKWSSPPDTALGKWSLTEPSTFPGFSHDRGLVLTETDKPYLISSQLEAPIRFDGTLPFVLQYEVKLQDGLQCGGVYLKLLRTTKNSRKYRPNYSIPYSILFGPERCGKTNRVHFSFEHQSPVTGEYQRKHLKHSVYIRLSKLTTLYTLLVNPDNTFKIFINREVAVAGSLLEDFEPAVNPPKEIADPYDLKPADHQGKWEPRMIENPGYFEDLKPCKFAPVTGIALDVQTSDANVLVDNILLTNDIRLAEEFAQETWVLKYDMERVALERELWSQGISDHPPGEYAHHQDPPSKLQVQLAAVRKILGQIKGAFMQFGYGLVTDPKTAAKSYPLFVASLALAAFGALWGIIGTIRVIFRSAQPVKPPMAVKKEEEEIPFFQDSVLKSAPIGQTELDSLTSKPGQDQSPIGRRIEEGLSRIPRPISPARPIKMQLRTRKTWAQSFEL